MIYLTKDGYYSSSLEFDGSVFELDDYVEITRIVYTRKVNQGQISCNEWFGIVKK